MRIFIPLLILALATGCEHLQPDRTPPAADRVRDGRPITSPEVLAIAGSYAGHPWRATEANVFHGTDATGAHIDTPDRAWWGRGGWYANGRINTGIPYCWGGDNTLAEFDAGVTAGRPAGYHFKGINRKKDGDPPDSALPVGVDCSGFVSRCWRLKVRKSTYDMTDVSHPLPSFDDLQPGDAVNKPHDHIILFVQWLDRVHERMLVLEAGDAKKDGNPENYERVHEDIYQRSWLIKKGFMPLRYDQIVESLHG